MNTKNFKSFEEKKENGYTVKEMSGNGLRFLLTFDKQNKNGERLAIEFSKCTADKYWKKYGINPGFEYWNVQTYATKTEKDGFEKCSGIYDLLTGDVENVLNEKPADGSRWVINFNEMKAATDENLNALIEKIEAIFFMDWPTFYKSMGYREREIWNNKEVCSYRYENGYQVYKITDHTGKSCEFSIKLNYWTN